MDLLTEAKAEAIAYGLEKAIGKKPNVVDMGDYMRIYWPIEDHQAIREEIERMISKKEPGDIRLEWIPVVSPLAIKKVLPFVIGIGVLGFMIGKSR